MALPLPPAPLHDLGVAPVPGAEPPARRQRGARRPVPPVTAALALAVAAVAVLPLGYLVVRAREVGLEGAADLVVTRRTLDLLLRSLGLAAAVTATAVVIGVPVGWLTSRAALPGRRIFTVLTALPLAVPSYVAALAVLAMFGPRGTLARWLGPLGVNELPEVYGFTGAWLALSLSTFPYVTLTVRGALRRLDPALEEISRSLGMGPVQTFRRVTLPQLWPAIAAGGLLTALYTFADFGTPSLMRYDTFTRVIYVQYKGSLDRSGAAVLALLLAAVALAVVAVEAAIRSRSRGARSGAGSARVARQARPVPLGRGRAPAVAGLAAVVVLALVLPLATLVQWLVTGTRQGIDMAETLRAAGHSAQAAGLGALVAVAAAWPVAVLGARHRGALSRWTERASYAGYALPGIVVALALVFFGARVASPLYQTVGMLVLAYLVLFLPQGVGALRSTLAQVSPRLEEASRSLGASRLRTTWQVLLPLVRPGAAAAFALVFLTAMKELPAALLLGPTGWDTLATRVWASTSEGFFARAAAPALVLVAVSSIPLTFLALRRDR
ncbi:MAG: ABC transporter permease [Acidimicrobiia bacterium]